MSSVVGRNRGVLAPELLRVRLLSPLVGSGGAWCVVTYSRGLGAWDGAGVSLKGTPTPSLRVAWLLGAGGWPAGAGAGAGAGFRSPLRAARSLTACTPFGGAAAGMAGVAGEGRGGSLLERYLFCACSGPLDLRLFMRTFRAYIEAVLVRRVCVGEVAEAEAEAEADHGRREGAV